MSLTLTVPIEKLKDPRVLKLYQELSDLLRESPVGTPSCPPVTPSVNPSPPPSPINTAAIVSGITAAAGTVGSVISALSQSSEQKGEEVKPASPFVPGTFDPALLVGLLNLVSGLNTVSPASPPVVPPTTPQRESDHVINALRTLGVIAQQATEKK